jgi:hypothetical protein
VTTQREAGELHAGAEAGGSRGVKCPPLTSQKFPLLLDFFDFLFSKFLVAHPKKIIKGQIFFKKIKFHESHHLLPFFHWFFNLKPVTIAAARG